MTILFLIWIWLSSFGTNSSGPANAPGGHYAQPSIIQSQSGTSI
jgi:hypothetical protein